MKFMREVSSRASRPIEAMVWINEIESAKSISDLKTLYAITGAKFLTNFEILNSRIASGLKKIINGDFKRRVFIQQTAARKKKRYLTGRKIAWMIYEYFKVSDTDCFFNEILKVELTNDSVHSFNTRWDETITAMKKQPDEEILFFLPTASTVRTASDIVVPVHSRYCSKR